MDQPSGIMPARAADLDGWSSHAWTGGVELRECAPLDRFAVRTQNSIYEVTVLEPLAGTILVRGGKFFPQHERVHLAGCSLGGSFLKLRCIYPGFLMELVHQDQTIITSPVISIDLWSEVVQ